MSNSIPSNGPHSEPTPPPRDPLTLTQARELLIRAPGISPDSNPQTSQIGSISRILFSPRYTPISVPEENLLQDPYPPLSDGFRTPGETRAAISAFIGDGGSRFIPRSPTTPNPDSDELPPMSRNPVLSRTRRQPQSGDSEEGVSSTSELPTPESEVSSNGPEEIESDEEESSLSSWGLTSDSEEDI